MLDVMQKNSFRGKKITNIFTMKRGSSYTAVEQSYTISITGEGKKLLRTDLMTGPKCQKEIKLAYLPKNLPL